MYDLPVIKLNENEYFKLSSSDFKKLYYDIEVQLIPNDGSCCFPHLGQCSIHRGVRCDCRGEGWGIKQRL